MQGSFPENPAVVLREAIELPGLRFLVFDRRDVTVQSDAQPRGRIAANGSDNEDVVSQDYRTGMSKAGNRSLPMDIGAGIHVP